jgi:hypothetical protein
VVELGRQARTAFHVPPDTVPVISNGLTDSTPTGITRFANWQFLDQVNIIRGAHL